MSAAPLAAESRNRCLHAFGYVLDAIDQVVRVLSLEALVERKELQAGEAHEIGVLDLSVATPLPASNAAWIALT